VGALNISPSELAALFGAMAVLAAAPSVSVLTVAARAGSHGFRHGAATAAGIVAGDLLFVLLAAFGLALLVEALGGLTRLLPYAAGAYMIALGVVLWRSRTNPTAQDGASAASLPASFWAGLLITLADQKAVLFYMGFLPAFIDIGALTTADIGAVMLITLLAVGGVKLGYAWAAGRAGALIGRRAGVFVNRLAACVLVLAGVAAMAGG
jgi:threonine/homoserine/homoserine lactone efflux protein